MAVAKIDKQMHRFNSNTPPLENYETHSQSHSCAEDGVQDAQDMFESLRGFDGRMDYVTLLTLWNEEKVEDQ